MTVEVNSLQEGDWVEVVKPAQCGCTNDVGHKYQALDFRVTGYGRCMHCNALHNPTISVQVTPEVNGQWCGIPHSRVRKCEPPAQLNRITQQDNENSLRKLGIEITESAQISGGPLGVLVEGWAKPMFSRSKAHYYQTKSYVVSLDPRETQFYNVSLCGLDQPAGYLFGAGSYQRCKRCEKKVNR